MASSNCLVTNILQNIFFCVLQKKETHTGEYDRIFIFVWAIPLNLRRKMASGLI